MNLVSSAEMYLSTGRRENIFIGSGIEDNLVNASDDANVHVEAAVRLDLSAWLSLATASTWRHVYSQILDNLVDFFFVFEQKLVRRCFENSQNSGMVQRKNVKLEKR